MIRLLIVFVLVLLSGCSDDSDRETPAWSPYLSLPGVYTGTFPCDGCPGIPTTLWLRSDSRFFFRQQYPSDVAGEGISAYSLGRWRWIDGDRTIELTGVGPSRAFVPSDSDTLVMRTESDLEHRLTRDPTAPDFSAIVRMAGTMRMRGDSATFTECLTGFVAPVDRGGDFTRFLHQYRSIAARGEPAHVELEGRFSWSDDGALQSLTIERFLTVRSRGAC